jgi:hypothetical protein
MNRKRPKDWPSRSEHSVCKVKPEDTGFNGPIFIHVDHLQVAGVRQIVGMRYSQKHKDDVELERIFTALGDASTDLFTEINARHGSKLSDVARSLVAKLDAGKPWAECADEHRILHKLLNMKAPKCAAS